MTYILREIIEVRHDAAFTPLGYSWRRRAYVVSVVANRWRVDMEWWQARIWREYFKLATSSGLLVVIYRDLTDGTWYIQRIYD